MHSFFLRLLTICFLLLGVAGCSRRTPPPAAPANLITRNDFEAMQGWLPESPSLTTEQARSGRFSLRVNPAVEYSTGYVMPLQAIGLKPGGRIRVSGWGRRSSFQCKAVVIVQVIDPAKGPKPLSWQAIDLHGRIKTINYWTPFSEEVALPVDAGPQARLQVYLWRTGPTDTTYLDDLEISRI
jgi:hypothetical protein